MKREHKLLSVGVAVLTLLVIAYAYNHSTKEGMSNKNNRRGASGLRTGPPQSFLEHLVEFLKFRWLLEMLGLASVRNRGGNAGGNNAAASAALAAARAQNDAFSLLQNTRENYRNMPR